MVGIIDEVRGDGPDYKRDLTGREQATLLASPSRVSDERRRGGEAGRVGEEAPLP